MPKPGWRYWECPECNEVVALRVTDEAPAHCCVLMNPLGPWPAHAEGDCLACFFEGYFGQEKGYINLVHHTCR